LRKYGDDQFREIARAWTELLTYTQQTLTQAQLDQVWANLGINTLAQKNYIINGAMMVSQENGSTSGSSSGYYAVDQFSMNFVNSGTQTAAQVASLTPGGSPTRLRITCTAADTSVAASDLCNVRQMIEGSRSVSLMLGTSSAKTVALRFGVKAPAGTYCISIHNNNQDRNYTTQYVISASEANTDVVRVLVIPLDNIGTWLTDNNIGMYVYWTLMAGSSLQGAADTWQAGNVIGTASQFNFMGAGGNVFELFDVSLTIGTYAPPFQVPEFAEQLLLCQRYVYPVALGTNTGGPQLITGTSIVINTGIIDHVTSFPVIMRIAPVGTVLSTSPVWTAGGTPSTANEIAFFNSTNSSFATLTGALGINVIAPSILGCKIRLSAGTSFGLVASGDIGNIFYGYPVRILVNARM
jgi:hypothetical protein